MQDDDQSPEEQPTREDAPPAGPTDVTGHPVVDSVLASFGGLEEKPVEEHVAVFDNAHDELRRALNDAGGG